MFEMSKVCICDTQTAGNIMKQKTQVHIVMSRAGCNAGWINTYMVTNLDIVENKTNTPEADSHY